MSARPPKWSELDALATSSLWAERNAAVLAAHQRLFDSASEMLGANLSERLPESALATIFLALGDHRPVADSDIRAAHYDRVQAAHRYHRIETQRAAAAIVTFAAVWEWITSRDADIPRSRAVVQGKAIEPSPHPSQLRTRLTHMCDALSVAGFLGSGGAVAPRSGIRFGEIYLPRRVRDADIGESSTPLLALLNDGPRCLVVADGPGTGKSYLCQHVASELARLASRDPAGSVPLVLRARQYTAGTLCEALSAQTSRIIGAPIHGEDVVTELEQGATVIVDSFDELVDLETARDLVHQLAVILTEYPRVRVLVATRPAVAEVLDPLQPRMLRLVPLTYAEVAELHKRWSQAAAFSPTMATVPASAHDFPAGSHTPHLVALQAVFETARTITGSRTVKFVGALRELVLGCATWRTHGWRAPRPMDALAQLALAFQLHIAGGHEELPRTMLGDVFPTKRWIPPERWLPFLAANRRESRGLYCTPAVRVEASWAARVLDELGSSERGLGWPPGDELLVELVQRSGVLVRHEDGNISFEHQLTQDAFCALAIHGAGPQGIGAVLRMGPGRFEQLEDWSRYHWDEVRLMVMELLDGDDRLNKALDGAIGAGEYLVVFQLAERGVAAARPFVRRAVLAFCRAKNFNTRRRSRLSFERHALAAMLASNPSLVVEVDEVVAEFALRECTTYFSEHVILALSAKAADRVQSQTAYPYEFAWACVEHGLPGISDPRVFHDALHMLKWRAAGMLDESYFMGRLARERPGGEVFILLLVALLGLGDWLGWQRERSGLPFQWRARRRTVIAPFPDQWLFNQVWRTRAFLLGFVFAPPGAFARPFQGLLRWAGELLLRRGWALEVGVCLAHEHQIAISRPWYGRLEPGGVLEPVYRLLHANARGEMPPRASAPVVLKPHPWGEWLSQVADSVTSRGLMDSGTHLPPGLDGVSEELRRALLDALPERAAEGTSGEASG